VRTNSARILGVALPLLVWAASASSHPIGKFFSTGAGDPSMSALAASTRIMSVLAPQAKKSSAPVGNLYKEVMDQKEKLRWKDAPPDGIPSDVCVILSVCAGGTPKIVTLPRAIERGQALGRGLFLTKTSDSPSKDAIVMEHQTVAEVYFFLLAPDGSLAKVAYIARGQSWTPMATSLAKAVFERDVKDWLAAIAKLGGGN
jgi:hypothetical protein